MHSWFHRFNRIVIPGFFGITGVIGVVLSAVGRSQAVREGGKTGFATAGIVIGIIVAGYCWIQLMCLSAMLS